MSRNGVQPDPQKIKALMDIPPPNNKRELQAFLGIIHYLGKISPSNGAVCDPLWKLISSRVAWTLNASYQSLFVKAKLLIKADICMKFYDDGKSLYLETDASRMGLGAALLQTREGAMCQKDTVPDNTILWPIAFASKSLTSADCRYGNIEREVPGILHRLEKFHQYCFVRDVNIITDHKPLVAIIKKEVATLSQQIQQILLGIHQYRIQIYTFQGPKFLLQIGCPITTIRRTI